MQIGSGRLDVMEMRYIPSPHKWLRDERWKDELTYTEMQTAAFYDPVALEEYKRYKNL